MVVLLEEGRTVVPCLENFTKYVYTNTHSKYHMAQSTASRQKDNTLHPDVEIKIKNFGPISSAHLNLSPLTIFAGPNNSGKSYAAALIYSVTLPQVRDTWLYLLDTYGDLVEGYPYDDDNVSYPFLKDASECLEGIKRLIKAGTSDVPDNVTRKLVKFCVNIMEMGLSSTIERNFGSPISDMIAIGKRSIVVTTENYDIHVTAESKNVTIKIPSSLKLHFTIEIGDMSHIRIRENDNEKSIMLGQTGPKESSESFAWYVICRIFLYISGMLKSNIKNSYYLPASRSGLMAGHRLMASGMLKSVAYANIERTLIPKISGITSDFMSTLIDAPQTRGPFFSIAESLEREMGGKITRTVNSETHLPEISYVHKRKKIPLHGMSSSVSEIAPLVLYLKHVVGRGDLLILEEPEAHLDFEMQRILARHIARMIRAGLNVLIATHSFFVQEQLSRCLSDGKPAPKVIKKLGWDKNEYLHADEISYYLFDKDNHKNDSYVARHEKISTDEGIPLTKFDESIEKLHRARVIVEYDDNG